MGLMSTIKCGVVLFSNAKLKLKLFYDKFVIVVNYKHSILFYDFVKEKQ
jgi:hypothetical protein